MVNFQTRRISRLKMWKKINSFIVIIDFSLTLQKLNRNPQACPPAQKIFRYALFFSPPTRKLVAQSLLNIDYPQQLNCIN